MAVEQIAFDIPSVIQLEINNGAFIRYGGVVRDQAGHIVAHLKEVPIPKVDSNVGRNKIVEFAQKNKYVLIGTVMIAAMAAGVTHIVIRKKKNAEVEIPKCIAAFNESFTEYIESIKKGNVSEKKIEMVIMSLEEMQKNQKSGNINIVFSIENVSLLLDMVRNYTIKFAEANSFEMTGSDYDKENEITSLQHYLKIQKAVFERCA